jgi:hypothetical protein
MAPSSIELCSSALVKLGANPISSFTEGTAEARVATHLYEIVRDALLAVHPWSFATTKAELTALPTPPVTDFDHAFALPSDFIKALSAGDESWGRGLVYQIVAGELHTHANEVVLVYIRRPDEAIFPSYFVAALVNRLAAEFCLPLTENASRAELLHQLATNELRLAKLADSQQDSPSAVEDFTLIEARSA